MNTKVIIIAIVIVLVLVLAVFLYKKNKGGSSAYTVGTTKQRADDAHPYACASSADANKTFCIIERANAESTCNADPKCIGYLLPDTASGGTWLQTQFPQLKNPVQLISAPTLTGGAPVLATVYAKPAKK